MAGRRAGGYGERADTGSGRIRGAGGYGMRLAVGDDFGAGDPRPRRQFGNVLIYQY
jgi:hypothetical protein